MLSERVVDWTQQWKQEGEAALLRRLLVRRLGALPQLITLDYELSFRLFLTFIRRGTS